MAKHNAFSDCDSKEEIIEILAPAIRQLELLGNGVLIATYIQPEKTKGGVLLTDHMRLDESRWQGKVGLVVGLGYDAFRWYEGDGEYKGPKPKLYDWVFYRASDSWEAGLRPDVKSDNFYSVKWVLDKDIKGIITRPDLVY